ncbi:MAG: OapB/ArvB family protein [Candidatus Nanoarchaeia archaeon]
MAKKKKRSKKTSKKNVKKKLKKLTGDLTIHFMPYSEIANLDGLGRIKKIMGLVLDNKIILLQGKLKPDEEAKLIEHTMTLVGNLSNFQGVEIATLSSDNEHKTLFEKARRNIARILVGEQDAVTIIGPASIVKEIKQDPKKLEFMLKRR